MSEPQLYLDRAREDIRASQANLDQNYSDYDILFTTEQALAQEVLEDARRFVERAEKYLRHVGAL